MWIGLPLQRAEDVRLEPRVNFAQHSCRHLLFSARKEVVETAFPKACALANERQACSLKAVLAENFGKGRKHVRPLVHKLRHGQSPSSASISHLTPRPLPTTPMANTLSHQA